MVFIITVNTNIVFTKQPTADRYLPNLFFTNNFVDFQKILAAHQKSVPKTFRKFIEKKRKNLWRSLILVKLQAFTEAAT